MNNEDRQLKRSIISRIVIITVIGVMLGLLVVTSFGWFATNNKLTTTGMGVTVQTINYDLKIIRNSPARYDNTDESAGLIYNVITDTGGLKDKIIADPEDFSLTETTTNEAPKLAYEMVSEYSFEGDYSLMPGSYGTVTFYIKPAAGKDNITAKFTLDLGAYVYTIVEDNRVLKKVNPNDPDATLDENAAAQKVLDLLKGHILFFKGRTGTTYEEYQYSDFIDDGVFSVTIKNNKIFKDTEDPEVVDAGTAAEPSGPAAGWYKIELYWEWPITYSTEILEKLSDGETVDKYPEEVGTFITNHPEDFFAFEAYDDNGYNDADQLIGSGADAMVLYIAAN